MEVSPRTEVLAATLKKKKKTFSLVGEIIVYDVMYVVYWLDLISNPLVHDLSESNFNLLVHDKD